jgi:hypothetical protein
MHTKRRNRGTIFIVIIIMVLLPKNHYGQEPRNIDFGISDEGYNKENFIAFQEKTPSSSKGEETDTNFTYEKYRDFLIKVSDTSKYILVPMGDFQNTINPGKVVIGLRHDVDLDLNLAYKFSETESSLGVRSTYFILHTAPYYLAEKNNMRVHSSAIIPILKDMQDNRHFEIGWHNDLVTLQAVYNIDPVSFLHNELAWLRSNGLIIKGTASHGSPYCYTYKYLNYYFFDECDSPAVGQFINTYSLPLTTGIVPMKKGKLSDFNLNYEAYFLNFNKAFSDATVTNNIRWNIGMLDLNQLHPGDRVSILIHPIHWHKASVNNDIERFSILGQRSSVIDEENSIVYVTMPYGSDKSSLISNFVLSSGAYAKVSGRLQVNGSSRNNFCDPVIYKVYAENRSLTKDWTIEVKNEKNSACSFNSFNIPEYGKSVFINTTLKTITVELKPDADIKRLPVQFELSPGAKAWIDDKEQSNNTGELDFSNDVHYKIVSEDGLNSCIWTVSLIPVTLSARDLVSYKKGLSVYPNPSDGIIHLKFKGIERARTQIEIYNSLGDKVYSNVINKSGNFTEEINISNLPTGVYIIKYSDSEKPVSIIIRHE